ncbi:MAG: DUF2927 domain-containing protein [Cyanothece sp. SIO1E1]|nr:DUF2927 domain-containing protein [Cyanothece sp. SIO1E1]
MIPALAQPAALTARNPDSWINIRSAPTTNAAINGSGWVGARGQILEVTQGRDGYTWYYVRFNQLNNEGWVRGDLVRRLNQSEVSSAQPDLAVRRSEPGSAQYTPEQIIDYFLDVALGSEYGHSSPNIRKWHGTVKIKILGSPTATDLETLNTVIDEINQLAHGIHLQIDNDNPNLEIYFVPEHEFSQYEPNYLPVNYGFGSAWSNQDVIYRSKILISTAGINQRERSHLIREELTQALGPMRDSPKYADSIFFQRWTDTTEYTELDKAVIAILYQPDIRPGMSRAEVLQVFENIDLTRLLRGLKIAA